MKLVSGARQRHSSAILAIFNEAIANSTALYDYQLRTEADMEAWFDGKQRKNYPVICAEKLPSAETATPLMLAPVVRFVTPTASDP